jgi:ribonucleoside-diphosphate reductase alpha chain
MNTTTKKEVLALTAATMNEPLEAVLARWESGEGKGFRATEAKMLRQIGFMYNVQVTLTPITAAIKEVIEPAVNVGIDYARDGLLTDFGLATLKDRYLLDGETSPQDAFMRAARAFSDDEAMAARIYNYASRTWMMYSTPVLSNGPKRLSWGTSFADNFQRHHFEDKLRGMPISCFLNYVPDSRDGRTTHYTETAWLSSGGGGVGGYGGAVRTHGTRTSGGSASSGAVPFMGVMDRIVLAFALGDTRRASNALYL